MRSAGRLAGSWAVQATLRSVPKDLAMLLQGSCNDFKKGFKIVLFHGVELVCIRAFYRPQAASECLT